MPAPVLGLGHIIILKQSDFNGPDQMPEDVPGALPPAWAVRRLAVCTLGSRRAVCTELSACGPGTSLQEWYLQQKVQKYGTDPG